MAKLTKAERRGQRNEERTSTVDVAGWVLVLYGVAWLVAFLLAAATAWSLEEELEQRRFLRCLERNTAQFCYMLTEVER